MTRDRLLALLKRVERSPDGGEPDDDEAFGGFGCNICGNVWRESKGGVNHDGSCELKAAIDWLERQPAGTDVLAAEPMSQRIYDDDAPDGSSYEMRTIWQSPRPPRNGGL